MNVKRQKIALITGADRGIGLEIARQLSKRKFTVIISSRNIQAGQSAVTEIIKNGGLATFLQIDVSDSENVARAATEFGKKFDYLSVLINNAGIYPEKGTNILTVTRKTMVEVFNTNAFGPLEMIQNFLPYLRNKTEGGARIINISSRSAQVASLTTRYASKVPGYCFSKLTLNAVTQTMSEIIKKDNIAVNSVCPGWTQTNMGGKDAPQTVKQGADTAVWLADQASQNITGKFYCNRKRISFVGSRLDKYKNWVRDYIVKVIGFIRKKSFY